eukprot:COSAG02_NODE_5512_length_4270_cov_12.845361_2_plen_90_part_00
MCESTRKQKEGVSTRILFGTLLKKNLDQLHPLAAALAKVSKAPRWASPPPPAAAAAFLLFLAGGSAAAAAAFLLFFVVGGYVTRVEGTC